jgi:hypothetical protein
MRSSDRKQIFPSYGWMLVVVEFLEHTAGGADGEAALKAPALVSSVTVSPRFLLYLQDLFRRSISLVEQFELQDPQASRCLYLWMWTNSRMRRKLQAALAKLTGSALPWK